MTALLQDPEEGYYYRIAKRLGERSALSHKSDPTPFSDTSSFLLISPTRDFIYNNTIGKTIWLAVQPVSY